MNSKHQTKFEYYTNRRVKIIAGPHKGKRGKVLGPSSCFHFDLLEDGTREVLMNIEETEMLIIDKKRL